MARKSERIAVRISPLLDSFIDKVRKDIEKEVGEPVSRAEAVRRLLWFVADLKAMPDVSLGPLAQKAASFERVFKKLNKAKESESAE